MPSQKDKKLVLLDSHAILHRAFHALPSFTSPTGEPTGALYGFLSMFLKIINEFNPDYLVACFDLPQPTFRHIAYDKYKAQRPKMDNELIPQIAKSKEILGFFGVPIYEKAGFEADDVLATIVEQVKQKKGLETIIVTGDLDTLQLVQKGIGVYAMKKGIKESVLYDTQAVKDRFGFPPKMLPDFKGLRGDPSDNIIGVPGVGEKTATTLIQNFGSLENVYKKLSKNEEFFKKVGITPRIINILKENKEEALFSKELAETRGDVPISFSLSDSAWMTNFDIEKIKNFFQESGFRSLLTRLPTGQAGLPSKMVYQGEKNNTEEESLSEEKKQEIKIAFWLLDSRRTNPSISDVLDFARTDSVEDAKKILWQEIKRTGLENLFLNIERPLVKVLDEMSKNGFLLNTQYLQKLSVDYHKKLEKIQKDIWKLAGGEFNISSPKQLSEVLFQKMGISSKGIRRTGQGTLSTRFSELEKIKDRHPVVKKIFLYRELAKLTSTYIDNLPNLTDANSRIHTHFNQAGTVTGRISSSEPNLQNIPTRTDLGKVVRSAFVAPKGWKIVSFDYSQIELRVAASLSGDKKLKEAFLRGDDIHTKVASEVFNVPFEKVDREMRRRAKIINFGIIYGMGINSLKKNLECSKEEAENFYNEYFSDFSGMKKYMEDTRKKVKRNGFAETLFGRRRYLPEIQSPIIFIRKEAERMAVNAPVQGTAADVMKIAMVRVDELIKKEFSKSVKMILQVHDELLFEVKNDTIKKVAHSIKKEMEKEDVLGVPILVDILIGDNWGEIKKYA